MALHVQVRGLDEAVQDRLRQRARQRNQSFNAYLLSVLTAEAERPSRAEVLARLASRPMLPGSSVGGIREERDRRSDAG